MAFHLRRLEPTEAPLLRRLRIAALRDAPDQFAETVAHALARPDQEWIGFAASAYVAESSNALVGLVFAFEDAADDTVGCVGGMWVAPASRRQGIGRALLHAVMAWAHGHQLMRLGLWAPAHSPAAVALYQQAGFRETGRRRRLPTGPVVEIIEMTCEL